VWSPFEQHHKIEKCKLNDSKETCYSNTRAFSQIEQMLNQNEQGNQIGWLEKLWFLVMMPRGPK
jgi:hypothetical protein